MNRSLTNVYQVGRRVFGDTPLEPLGSRLYWGIADRLYSTDSPIQFYHVRGLPEPFEPFTISMGKSWNNAIVHGQYERPVMERFAETVTPDSTVWEIGARWGYYSFAAATAGADIVAAEGDPERVSLLHATRYANDADSVRIQTGFAGEDYSLNAFDPPDVALVDVEGAELGVLETADRWLDAGTQFLIELHGERGSDTEVGVLALLDEWRYSAEELYERSDVNRHVHARPAGE